MTTPQPRIAIIGLGYVGAPLLAAFAERYAVVGYDIDPRRVQELEQGVDRTRELSTEELGRVRSATLTSDIADLVDCNTYIVTVPTPVTEDKQPDFRPLQRACEEIGPLLAPGDIVVFESTVYPGATEEVCVPVLERHSGLKGGRDFWFGYSPERINPGDPQRRLKDIVKVVSGCCDASLDYIDALYSSIVPAGIHRAPSVKVAEAAKVIENTQRDVNIALVNELAMLFDRLGLDTQAVLEAAGTKWNFLPFRPGLVGGHCIPVDPYYLTHKAREVGFEPNVILAGRDVNDGMAHYTAEAILKRLDSHSIPRTDTRVLVLGLAFKPNCPDTRNSQVYKLVAALESSGCIVEVHDPWVRFDDAIGVNLVASPDTDAYSVVVLAVAHGQFLEGKKNGFRQYRHARGIFLEIGQHPHDEPT